MKQAVESLMVSNNEKVNSHYKLSLKSQNGGQYGKNMTVPENVFDRISEQVFLTFLAKYYKYLAYISSSVLEVLHQNMG